MPESGTLMFKFKNWVLKSFPGNTELAWPGDQTSACKCCKWQGKSLRQGWATSGWLGYHTVPFANEKCVSERNPAPWGLVTATQRLVTPVYVALQVDTQTLRFAHCLWKRAGDLVTLLVGARFRDASVSRLCLLKFHLFLFYPHSLCGHDIEDFPQSHDRWLKLFEKIIPLAQQIIHCRPYVPWACFLISEQRSKASGGCFK